MGKVIHFLIIIFIVLISLILLQQLFLRIWKSVSNPPTIGPQPVDVVRELVGEKRIIPPKEDMNPTVTINSARWNVEIAKDSWKMARGLSGRELLPENEGMLFVFKKPKRYIFWMKGVKFPLDFVWIKEGRVVDVTENAPPLTLESPVYYRPKETADMVLEINAGQVKKFSIKIGDRVNRE